MTSQFFFLLGIVAPVFLLMGAGFGLRKAKVLTAEADRSLLGIVVNLLVPCLALDVIIGNSVFDHPRNLVIPPIAGFLTIALGLAACRLAAAAFRIGEARTQRTFAHAAGIQNYGYIAIPLCQAVFDRDTVGVLFAFNLGVEIAFWTIGIATLTGQTSRRDAIKAINPPIIAVPCALALNALGADAWMPAAIQTAIHMLGQCAVPLGVTMSGAILADYANLGAITSGWRKTALAILLRCGLLPLLILLATRFLPLDKAMKSVLVVQAAMPAAVFPIVMAKLHHGDVPTALAIVLGTSAVALLTIPLWLGFGLRWAF